ncbi:MAG: porphobilinogen synthase [Alphaproteobacteria bacterium]
MTYLNQATFQQIRLRRNRKNHSILDLVADVRLCANNLILPIFVVEGANQKQKIDNLPDVYRFSLDLALEQAKQALDLGIKALMIFPVIDKNLKCDLGQEALNPNNLVCKTIRHLKQNLPELQIICDIALDPFTSHGHDGIIDKNFVVKNDETVEILCKQALNYANSGCDIVAPSDMMDGRVLAIRCALDEHKFQEVSIMSYASKYASNLYGPFRDAVGSQTNLVKNDKSNYQMDFRRKNEAILECKLDIDEGADLLIVKPASFYLDIIYRVSSQFQVPVFGYQVSGEYAMLKYLALHSKLDFNKLLTENLIAIKRAGATGIITYGAMEIAQEITKNFR